MTDLPKDDGAASEPVSGLASFVEKSRRSRRAGVGDIDMPGVPSMKDIENTQGFENKIALARLRREAIAKRMKAPESSYVAPGPSALTSEEDAKVAAIAAHYESVDPEEKQRRISPLILIALPLLIGAAVLWSNPGLLDQVTGVFRSTSVSVSDPAAPEAGVSLRPIDATSHVATLAHIPPGVGSVPAVPVQSGVPETGVSMRLVGAVREPMPVIVAAANPNVEADANTPGGLQITTAASEIFAALDGSIVQTSAVADLASPTPIRVFSPNFVYPVQRPQAFLQVPRIGLRVWQNPQHLRPPLIRTRAPDADAAVALTSSLVLSEIGTQASFTPHEVQPLLPDGVNGNPTLYRGADSRTLPSGALMAAYLRLDRKPISATFAATALAAPVATALDVQPSQSLTLHLLDGVNLRAELGRTLPPLAVQDHQVQLATLAPESMLDKPGPLQLWADLPPIYEEPAAILDRPADAARISVLLNAPRAIPADAVAQKRESLAESGYRVGEPRRVSITISRDQIRYFHSVDAAAAQALGATIGARVRDFTNLRPRPGVGTIEIWLAGGSGRVARAPTREEILRSNVLRRLRQR